MANSRTFDLIFSLETRALKPDADMVLNLIDGLMFGFLRALLHKPISKGLFHNIIFK